MVKKAPWRTAERILKVALELFNRFGEPNVSTTLISAELGISPGNLYYHCPAKDGLINSLFDRYERALNELLAEATATSMVVLLTYWLSFEYVRDPRHALEPAHAQPALLRGVHQMLSLLVPCLEPAGKIHPQRLLTQCRSTAGLPA